MCAKIEVIWRWSKKSPHSGGTIWSNLSQFWTNVIFSTTSKSPKISFTRWPTCAKHVYERNFWKKLFYNAPLRHRPMFSAASLEGIINSKKSKKIQNLRNLALFVQEIMCVKIEVIWRLSKKCPHSGGTIWSFNLSQSLKKGEFFHHLQITQIFLYMVTHMCQTWLWIKIWKNNILQCPLEV